MSEPPVHACHPHDFLKYMAVNSCPGLYVLGSFARHVTIYSQQVRAINLIDSLCRTGQIRKGTAVIVVGGGVAGLTAAAAALVRGAKVTLIEQALEGPIEQNTEEVAEKKIQYLSSFLCPIQSNSGDRYLHPHIYDWPDEGAENPEAGLPLLDWKAGKATEVFAGFRSAWAAIAIKFGPVEMLGFTVHDIIREQGGLRAVSPERVQSATGDLVILAVGFGREPSRQDYRTYWEGSPLDSVQESKLIWLVSGWGDGALTDLMRLCVQNFQHINFVEPFAKDELLMKELRAELAKPSPSIREGYV